tara:strand:- start:298 stop:498 length:201 start_codon:yes stop_codon:yes gene_type:complete
MAKKKIVRQPDVKNQYDHNLSGHTIVTDANSFEAKGERYVLSGDYVINIRTKERHLTEWKRIKKYF